MNRTLHQPRKETRSGERGTGGGGCGVKLESEASHMWLGLRLGLEAMQLSV
jgi:hypothetical protein